LCHSITNFYTSSSNKKITKIFNFQPTKHSFSRKKTNQKRIHTQLPEKKAFPSFSLSIGRPSLLFCVNTRVLAQAVLLARLLAMRKSE
jgi:hypothetical protein